MPMNERTAVRPGVTGRWLVATAAALGLLALLAFLLLRPAAGVVEHLRSGRAVDLTRFEPLVAAA
jgi:hypothetical protein